MIQLTEEEAGELLDNISFDCDRYQQIEINKNDTINIWKDSGFIKKSKLEEVEEYFTKLTYYDLISKDNVTELQKLYKEAIKEILEGKK